MGDDDLIRRTDALAEIDLYRIDWADAYDAIAALPAVAPGVQVEGALSDPVAVHANMLRGTIAKPTVEQIIHIYGADALRAALTEGTPE